MELRIWYAVCRVTGFQIPNSKFLIPIKAAFQFITILPVGKPADFQPLRMIPYFPIVGLILGMMTALFDLTVSQLWPPGVAALLDVIFLIIITGAFHLDGLGDAADGLYGQRSFEKALAIMKDSRLGAMGLVAIICGLSVKWAGIAELDSHRSLWLIIIPAYSRGSMLFGLRFLPYGRPDGGTGMDFFDSPLPLRAFSGLLIPLILSLFLGWRGIGINLFFILLTGAILYYYKKKLGCITGDMLGAMGEVIEATLFLLATAGAMT
ncbi:adenosylcobinamide-GDP ribazoletransferase [Desulfococcaceae bacterium HSG7]|nr:adenosylcobinamide-GDP ribazoletransferase [Desulfococcaceae bacterium HSG7]